MSDTTEIKKDDKAWMVIYTRSRSEMKVDSLLTSKNIECYCPTRKVEKQWSDRKKIIEEVIFRSYLFVRITEAEIQTVLGTDRVMNFIYYNKKPAVIRDEEIDIIKKYLNEKDVEVSTFNADDFEPNTKVMINHGVFMDNKGVVLKSNKSKVYVLIESLSQVMVIEFSKSHVTPMV